ncbi:MAG TPA: site-specific integrase [Streptosporangiaceae bacterium]
MPGRRQQGEGSLYQRNRDGRWVAVADLGWTTITGPDGKPVRKRDRRTFTGPDPETAIDKRSAFLDRRRDGFTIPKGRQPYVSEWMRHWLENIAKPKVQPTTFEGSYRQKVNELICPYFEQVPLPDLDEEKVEAWHRQLEARVSKRTGKPLSASTIGQAHRIMSAALKVAVIRGRIPRNPCSNVTPPSVPELDLDPPSEAEVNAILDRCESWPNGARWVLAITTGLRQGEALALEWRDVRLKPPASVTVRRSAAMVRGQGRVVKSPKSKSSRRTVPLPARAIRALTALQERQPALPTAPVFTVPSGKPVYPAADWGDWCALLDDLKLPHYRVHDLRHGYATMLLEAGQDPRVVQDLLSHSSGVLLKRYQHVRPVLHQRAADAIDAVLGE